MGKESVRCCTKKVPIRSQHASERRVHLLYGTNWQSSRGGEEPRRSATTAEASPSGVPDWRLRAVVSCPLTRNARTSTIDHCWKRTDASITITMDRCKETLYALSHFRYFTGNANGRLIVWHQ